MKYTIVGLLVSLMLLSGNLVAKVPVTQSQKLRLTEITGSFFDRMLVIYGSLFGP